MRSSGVPSASGISSHEDTRIQSNSYVKNIRDTTLVNGFLARIKNVTPTANAPSPITLTIRL